MSTAPGLDSNELCMMKQTGIQKKTAIYLVISLVNVTFMQIHYNDVNISTVEQT